MYLVISLLVLRAGCGIRLYQFLIIAYRFPFQTSFLIFLLFKNLFKDVGGVNRYVTLTVKLKQTSNFIAYLFLSETV